MRRAIKVLGLGFGLVLSACGREGEDEVGRFVGRWRPAAGEVKTMCPGEAERGEAPAADVVWMRGAASDLVSRTPLTPCRLAADLMDETASIVPGHRCTYSDGAGGTVTVTFGAYAFWVTPDGRTALESASGEVTHVVQGDARVCSFRDSSWYRRVDEATPADPVR
jgi:hypothetical protein